MSGFTESVVEDATLAWLEALGYVVSHGPDIVASEPAAERSDPMACGETLTDIDNCLQFDTCLCPPTVTEH
jgi:hypothetical protein